MKIYEFIARDDESHSAMGSTDGFKNSFSHQYTFVNPKNYSLEEEESKVQ